MELSEFIIGKSYTLDGSTGIFLGDSLARTHIRFNWTKNPDRWNSEINLAGKNFPRIKPVGPQMSSKEQIALRCKRLWNNSNYVKQNPQRSY